MKMLKFVKTFEDMNAIDTVPVIDLNSKKLKFKWKRSPMTTGKYSSFDNNNLRSYECKLNGVEIGGLYNVSHGIFSKDDSEQWYIMFFGKGNVMLTKKFDLDKVKEAMSFFEEAYISILNSIPEKENLFKMKENILALNRFKIKEITKDA